MAEPAQPADRDTEFARVALPLLPVIARVAQALTHDAADADDLVQDTFLKAYRHWNTFEPGSDARRWLSAIARNTFFAQRARERWVTAVGDDHELETFAAVSLHKLARDRGVEDMFSRLDLAPAITAAIDALEPQYRDVVRLVDVEDLKYDEAADVLGIPIGTVRSRLYRARRQLQEKLVQFAIDAGFRGAVFDPSDIQTTHAQS
ncbi:MAG: sigma-70 family RNA polymerase sigma factor [Gemmatimonadaceae bacterium]